MTDETVLANLPVHEFLARVQARTPTPGGGSAAALAGCVGAALATMAVTYTRGRKDAELEGVLETLEDGLGELSRRLQRLADEDAAAYEAVRQARRMVRDSEAEQRRRQEAIQQTTREATQVPLRIVRLCREGLELLGGVVERLNPHLATDAASAALLLRGAARSAAYNVRVNLGSLEASEETDRTRTELERLLGTLEALESRVLAWVDEVLHPS